MRDGFWLGQGREEESRGREESSYEAGDGGGMEDDSRCREESGTR